MSSDGGRPLARLAMASDDRTNGQPQQPLYMTPQTENLGQMYLLVDKLVKQLQTNRKEKERILRNVDVLSKQLNKQPPAESGKTDAVLFDRFLSQRVVLSEEDKADTADAADMGRVLKRQNEQLRKVLDAKVNLNRETMDVLRVHEDSLEQVVALLREDVAKYHKSFISRVQNKLSNELIPLEDKEFLLYMDNVSDIQQLIHVSELYRYLLRLAAEDPEAPNLPI